MLPWAEYGGTTSERGRVNIWQQGAERKKVWSSHKMSENMVCTFSVVLNRCYGAQVKGQTNPVVPKLATADQPKPLLNSPTLVVATVALDDRETYRSDNMVNISFPFDAILALIGAAIGGVLLAVFYSFGFYYAILSPIMVSFLVLPVLIGCLKVSHCRNPVLGVGLGVLCGLTLYLSHFYFLMVYHDPKMYLSFDQVFPYMIYNISNREIHFSTGVVAASGFNFWYGIADFMVTMVVLVNPPRTYCQSAYSSTCQQWMTREVVRTSPGNTPAFILAFSQLSHNPIRGLLYYKQQKVARYPHTRVMVEYTPEFEGYEPPEVFLSVNECTHDNWWGAPTQQGVCIYRKKFTRQEIDQTLKIFKFESKKPSWWD
jgi:hypothetical protein